MKICGYMSIEKKENQKITSYGIEFFGKRIMLDYGGKLGEQQASKIDAIFITHEHFDHFYGLTFELEYINCPIYATRTTKRLIRLLAEKSWNAMLVSSKKKLEDIIEIEYFKDYEFFGGIMRFYPSGHTFGSSMIYLEGEYKLLYTGDMDYNKTNPKRQYFIDDITKLNGLDYLLIDGTTLTKAEYKTQFINHIVEQSSRVRNRTYNVRPEKAVFIAQKFSEYKGTADAIIIYEQDLKWYLDILYAEGYYPYVDDKVVLDAPYIINKSYEKTIRLSSENYKKHVINGVVGLHISLEEIENFIYSLSTTPKVLIGHYSFSAIDEVKEICTQREYILIQQGENIIEEK